MFAQCPLHQLCSRASLTPLNSCSHSAPTLLLLHFHAAIKLQLCHLSRGMVTDANQRVYSLQHLALGSLAWRSSGPAAGQACTRPPTRSSCSTAASSPRAPTSRTWLTRQRASRPSAAARTWAQAESCPTAARLVRQGIYVICTTIKILTLGTGPRDVCTCWEGGQNMAICCKDLTATYSTFGAALLVMVRWGIHVILNVIKILTLGTGPGNVCTSWECGWNMLRKFDSNLAPHD